MDPNQPDFVFGYLPFWIVNYGLAVVTWCCVGRFLLGFLIARQPQNYIWRSFLWLTNWAVVAASWITPRYVHPVFLPPIAAMWLFLIRIALFMLMWRAGLTPSVTPPGGGL